MIRVYKYKVYDINSDSYVEHDTFATKEFIDGVDGATFIEDDSMDVNDVYIDGNGKLILDYFIN